MTMPITPLQRDIYYRGYRLSMTPGHVAIFKDADLVDEVFSENQAKLTIDSWMEAK